MMFGGLELKGSSDNKKRDGDAYAVSKDSTSTNVPSGFSFLQTSAAPNTPSASTSGFSFLSSVEPSSLSASEDVSPPTSSFSFISLAPSTPSHGTNIMNTTVSTSGFSFVDAIADHPSSSSAVISSYGDDILNLTAPTMTAPSTPTPVDLSSQPNVMDTKQVDTDKPSLKFSSTTPMGSSLTHSWGPSSLSDAKISGDKGTNNYDDDILSIKNPIQPIVFGGTAASKATGAIKKRSRTYKVGTGANIESSVLVGDEQATASNIESHPQTESNATPVSTYDGRTPNPITSRSSIAEEAEKALQKAVVFIEEKSTEATYSKTADSIVKVPSVETAKIQSPSKDLAYQQAAAAAQEAKGMIKQSSGSSFISGLFKRPGSHAPGIPTFSNHPSSSSTKSPSFVPSVKITSANVDSDTKGSYASSSTVESRQQVATPDDHGSSTKINIDKVIPPATIQVMDTEKLDTAPIQVVSPTASNDIAVRDKCIQPVQVESPSDTKLNESEYIGGSIVNKDTIATINETKTPIESQVHGKFGSAIIPSNRPSSLLDMMLNDFYSRCLRANDLIERIKVRQRTHVSDLKAAEKELQLTSYRISQAESQQMFAAEREDFDLAEVLTADIEKYMRAKSEQEKIVTNAKEAITDLEKQRQSAIDTVAHEFREVEDKLVTFKKEQETVGQENVKAVIEQFALTSKRFSVESDRLTSDLKNIERDEAFVEQERKELENQISEQSKDLYHSRDTARDQLDAACKEVEELKKLLAAKEAQVSELTFVVAQHEASIMQVRSKFSRQLTRVEKKEMAVRESRTEWEGEQATFKRQKEKHETEVAAHSEYLLSKEKIILRAQREISSIDKIEDLVMKEIFMVGDVDINSESASLVDLESSVVSLEVAVDEANQGLLVAQAAVDLIQDEISSIDAKLPMLEAEKREAAVKRDFKVAGKASKEIKDLTARRDECDTNLSGESRDRLQQAHRNLEKVTSELCSQKEAVQVKRVELGRSQMILIATKIRKLQKLKEDADNCLRNSDDADGVGVISSTASAMIASRIATLIAFGEQLGAVNGGWDEIIQESSCDVKERFADEEPDVETTVLAGPDTDVVTETEYDIVITTCLNEVGYQNVDTDINGESTLIPIGETVMNDHGATTDKANAILRFKEISTTLRILEREVEKAAEEENYDEAAQFDETIASLRSELESLGVSEADITEESDNKTLEAEELTRSASLTEEETSNATTDNLE